MDGRCKPLKESCTPNVAVLDKFGKTISMLLNTRTLEKMLDQLLNIGMLWLHVAIGVQAFCNTTQLVLEFERIYLCSKTLVFTITYNAFKYNGTRARQVFIASLMPT